MADNSQALATACRLRGLAPPLPGAGTLAQRSRERVVEALRSAGELSRDQPTDLAVLDPTGECLLELFESLDSSASS